MYYLYIFLVKDCQKLIRLQSCLGGRLIRYQSFLIGFEIENFSNRVGVGRNCRNWQWSSYLDIQLVDWSKIKVFRSDPKVKGSNRHQNFFPNQFQSESDQTVGVYGRVQPYLLSIIQPMGPIAICFFLIFFIFLL